MSQYPVIAAGTDLTAKVLNWMLPLVGYKTASQSVTSSTTYVADTALTVPVEANATYTWEAFVIYDGGTQGSSDLKIEPLTSPFTGIAWTSVYIDTTGAQQLGSYDTAPIVAGTNGAGNNRVLRMVGSAVVSTAAANLTLQWAQSTSNATATTVHNNSWLAARRVA